MKGLNRVHLIGQVGKDPEIRYSQSGTAVVTFSLATNDYFKDKRTGEKVEKTAWHNLVAFGKIGELISEYVRKGSRLYLEGSLDYQQYEKDGEKKYITKIAVKDFNMLDSLSRNNNNSSNKDYEASVSDSVDSSIEDDEVPF